MGAVLPIQLPMNVLGKPVEDDPAVGATATQKGDLESAWMISLSLASLSICLSWSCFLNTFKTEV